MRAFQGIWPALVTPFALDNTLNLPVLSGLVEYLIEKKVSGLYVGGTTGEGIFMSVIERKTLAETVLKQVNGRIPVIIHVGCTALADAVELARHAQDAGASAISSILPPYYQTTESLVAYFKSLAAAAPELPIIAYIFGGNIDTVKLMRQFMTIPNVAGAKYTGPNMNEFRQIVELADWTVFSGMDEQSVYAAMQGSSGHIGSTLNLMPGVYRKIHACVQSGDLKTAQELQLQVNQVTNVLLQAGFQGALKDALSLLGFDCGQPRLPHLPLDAEHRQAFRTELETTHFFDLARM